jgi:hypothetical protein
MMAEANTDDFLLITPQLLCISLSGSISIALSSLSKPYPHLQSNKHGMCLADQPHGHRTLFYRLKGILDLEDTTLRRAAGMLAMKWWEKWGSHKVTESLS